MIFNLALLIDIFIDIFKSYDNILRWMPQDLTDDKSTLVLVMAWCRQATCHYLIQCWPSSMSPYGVTRPQRVKRLVYESFAKCESLHGIYIETYRLSKMSWHLFGMCKTVLWALLWFQNMARCSTVTSQSDPKNGMCLNGSVNEHATWKQ